MTGGVWDRGANRMMFQAVLCSNMDNSAIWGGPLLISVPDLMNTAKKGGRASWLSKSSRGCPVLLDSGVFGIAASHADTMGISINEAVSASPSTFPWWQEFVDGWIECVTEVKECVWGYVELDIGSPSDKKGTRAMIEAVGLNPIPVVHPLSDGWGYFDEVADKYDRVCVSNLVKATQSERETILRTVAERRAGRRVEWIHALGVTVGRPLLSWPTESCDSTAHSNALMYGGNLPDSSGLSCGNADGIVYSSGCIDRMVGWMARDAAVLSDAFGRAVER